MASQKQPRNRNWSTEEMEMLVELVAENYHFLYGKHSNTVTESRKSQIWLDISSKISALGVPRNPKESKKKFGYLKSDAKKHANHRSQTGGGPPLPETPRHFRTILEIVPKEGISGCSGVER